MASGKDNDGVVTSASSKATGSLLTDLLSDAKKGVAQERQKLERTLQSRETEERERRQREEARKREEMLRKINEETRLRNQALNRRGRDADRKDASTRPQTRPTKAAKVEAKPVAAPKTAPQPTAEGRGGLPMWLVAALALGGVAVGVGGAFALNAPPPMPITDVSAAARATVANTRIALSAEGRVKNDLRAATATIKSLNAKVDEIAKAQKDLQAKLAATESDLATTKSQLAAAQSAAGSYVAPTPAPTRKWRPKKPKTGGTGKIDTNVFGP